MTLMSRGIQFLNSNLPTAAGITVTYRRGADAIEDLAAVVGRTEFSEGETENTTITSRVRDYLILIADLLIDGDPIKPQIGDTIEEESGDTTYTFTVMALDNGEVSAFFHEVVQIGDTVELRGPIGGHFTWSQRDGGPLLLVGGGSGVVPLVSILRHRMNVAPEMPAVLVYSAREMDEVIFRDELIRRAEADPNLTVIVTLTREKPTDPRTYRPKLRWSGMGQRVEEVYPRFQVQNCGKTELFEKLHFECRGCPRPRRDGNGVCGLKHTWELRPCDLPREGGDPVSRCSACSTSPTSELCHCQ